MPSNDEVIDSILEAIKASAEATTAAAEKKNPAATVQYANATRDLAASLGPEGLKIQINPGR